MRLTPEIKSQIHAALEQTGGSYRKAAPILGVPASELKDALRQDNDLRTRWCPGFSPSQRSQSLEKTDSEIMRAEDSQLRQGLESMGLSTKQSQIAISLRQFHGRHYAKCIDIIGAGVIKTYLGLLESLDDINEQLANREAHSIEPEDVPMLLEHRIALAEQIGRMHDRWSKAALQRAIIEEKKANMDGTNKATQRKPGFSPMLLKADNLTIHEAPRATEPA